MKKEDVIKCVFALELGSLSLRTQNIDTKAVWKRSQEIASSTIVPLISGKANYSGQTLKLKVNMVVKEGLFEQKKTQLSFYIIDKEKERPAGVVIIDPSYLLNNKLQEQAGTFPLQKCPDTKATIEFKLRLLDHQARDPDSMSQVSAADNLSQVSGTDTSLVDIDSVGVDRAEVQTKKGLLASQARQLLDLGSQFSPAVDKLSTQATKELKRLKDQNKELKDSLARQQEKVDKLQQTTKDLASDKQRLGAVQRSLREQLSAYQITKQAAVGDVEVTRAELIDSKFRINQLQEQVRVLRAKNEQFGEQSRSLGELLRREMQEKTQALLVLGQAHGKLVDALQRIGRAHSQLK